MPLHNYFGPGTKLAERLDRGDVPVSGLDAAALIHDIEYENNDQTSADNNMYWNLIREYPYMPQIAALVRAGFFVKDIIGYDNKTTNSYHKYKTIVKQKDLLNNYNSKFADDI